MLLYVLLIYCIIGALHHYVYYLMDKNAGIENEISSSIRFTCALLWILVDFVTLIAIIRKIIQILHSKKEKK